MRPGRIAGRHGTDRRTDLARRSRAAQRSSGTIMPGRTRSAASICPSGVSRASACDQRADRNGLLHRRRASPVGKGTAHGFAGSRRARPSSTFRHVPGAQSECPGSAICTGCTAGDDRTPKLSVRRSPGDGRFDKYRRGNRRHDIRRANPRYALAPASPGSSAVPRPRETRSGRQRLGHGLPAIAVGLRLTCRALCGIGPGSLACERSP